MNGGKINRPAKAAEGEKTDCSQGLRTVMYLQGLHHKVCRSSPNSARHFFGVFASVSIR